MIPQSWLAQRIWTCAVGTSSEPHGFCLMFAKKSQLSRMHLCMISYDTLHSRRLRDSKYYRGVEALYPTRTYRTSKCLRYQKSNISGFKNEKQMSRDQIPPQSLRAHFVLPDIVHQAWYYTCTKYLFCEYYSVLRTSYFRSTSCLQAKRNF